MPSNFTANYNLSQWERTDKVQMEDFNADNDKIDAALKAEADARTAADSAINTALSKRGNCQMYVTRYTGNGKYGKNSPSSLTFPWNPDFLLIMTEDGNYVITARGNAKYCVINSPDGSGYISWNQNTVSWYSDLHSSAQMNFEGRSYNVFAFRTLN